MKKILSLLLILLLLCALSISSLTSCAKPAKDPLLEDSSEVNGQSETVQTPTEEDKPSSETEADTEHTENTNQENTNQENKPTAPIILFDPIRTVYCEGGFVKGNTTGIFANSSEGYRFVGWTDGETAIQKSASIESVKDNTVRPIFEPIFVELYVADLLIESVAVSEFVTRSEADLLVSLRGKIFQKWEAKNAPIDLNETDSVLAQIKQYWNDGAIKDLPNFKLTASFTDRAAKDFYAFRTIAHALGGAPWLAESNTYLNSLEVFEYHYSRGQRFFEIDLCLTMDGKIVALHQYETQILYDEFMATKREGFTPIDLEILIDLMLQYPEIYIDLDILSVYRSGYEGSAKEKLTLFYDSLDAEIRLRDDGSGEIYGDIYERFVLEIFFDSHLVSQMLELAKQEKYGFEHFMYAGIGDKETPTGTGDDAELEKTLQWCVENDIRMMSTKILDKEFIEMTDRYDIFTFAYTYNSPEQIEVLLSLGIDCVFTDFVYL